MTVYGIAMVKNEQDVIGDVLSHMVEQVDRVIVADNMSTDRTREILESFDIDIIDDNDPAYRQSEKMTTLAMLAKDAGADWVVPFDADEIWRPQSGTLSTTLDDLDKDICVAWIYNHIATGGNSIKEMPYRLNEVSLHKVAVRTAPDLVIHVGNHNAHYMTKDAAYYDTGAIKVHHFPYRNVDQFVNKAVQGGAALALTDMPYNIGQHWRDYAAIAERSVDELRGVFYRWFYEADPKNSMLVYDPV